MGNKQSVKNDEIFIGDVLRKKADEINRLKFMLGPVMDRLKLATLNGIYFIDVTDEEMGPLGESILKELKLIVELNKDGYRVYIRKLK